MNTENTDQPVEPPAGQSTSSVEAHRPRSRQPGYKTPYRRNTEPLITYLPPGYRAEIKKLAAIQRTSAKQLVAGMLTKLVDLHRTNNPHVEQVIAQTLSGPAEPTRPRSSRTSRPTISPRHK